MCLMRSYLAQVRQMESPPLSLVHRSKKVIVIILMLFVHRSKGANSISWIDCYFCIGDVHKIQRVGVFMI